MAGRCESKFLVGGITSPLAVTSARTSFGVTPSAFIFSGLLAELPMPIQQLRQELAAVEQQLSNDKI
jgi:hypothetical protein